MAIKFLRQETHRHKRLGKNRKKLHRWRRPVGRHSKMRQQRKSYPRSPTIGFKKPGKHSGKIQGLIPILVYNTKDLSKIDKNSIAVIARIGAKKKLEIIKEAESKKIKILNIGVKQ